MFGKAIHDTFDGHLVRTIFMTVGGAIISWGVVYALLGRGEAMIELPFIYAGIAGAIGPLSVLFLWNLAAAPYRLQRSELVKLKAQNGALLANASARCEIKIVDSRNVISPVDQNHDCRTLVVQNMSSTVTAGGVRVTLTRVLLANGHTRWHNKKLLSQSESPPPIDINPDDAEEFRYYTIKKRAPGKGMLGMFEDSSLQPMDAGKHYIEIKATAKNAEAVFAVCMIDIDGRGNGRYSSPMPGSLDDFDRKA